MIVLQQCRFHAFTHSCSEPCSYLLLTACARNLQQHAYLCRLGRSRAGASLRSRIDCDALNQSRRRCCKVTSTVTADAMSRSSSSSAVRIRRGLSFCIKGKAAYLVGAGHQLGNAGDDFQWMDSWKLAAPTSEGIPADRLVVEREGSASGMVYFARGRYRWKQLGD